MSLERGRIVRSKAGRDKDRFLVVVSEDVHYRYLCDGKERPLERAKRKNRKHLRATNCYLNEEQLTTNKVLRRALRHFVEESPSIRGGE